MLSRRNIELTTINGYEFILGERVETLPGAGQKQLLDLSTYTQDWTYSGHDGTEVCVKHTTLLHEGRTIIATYSAERAKKIKTTASS